MKNKNAVKNELRKHVGLIKNPNVKERIHRTILEAQEIEKKKNRLSELQKLINDDGDKSGSGEEEEEGESDKGEFQEESVDNEGVA